MLPGGWRSQVLGNGKGGVLGIRFSRPRPFALGIHGKEPDERQQAEGTPGKIFGQRKSSEALRSLVLVGKAVDAKNPDGKEKSATTQRDAWIQSLIELERQRVERERALVEEPIEISMSPNDTLEEMSRLLHTLKMEAGRYEAAYVDRMLDLTKAMRETHAQLSVAWSLLQSRSHSGDPILSDVCNRLERCLSEIVEAVDRGDDESFYVRRVGLEEPPVGMDREGFIYFICRKYYRTAVKIGWSEKDPVARKNAFSTGNEDELEILAVIKGTYGNERELHQKYKRLHKRREWFWLKDELKDYLETVTGKKLDPVKGRE